MNNVISENPKFWNSERRAADNYREWYGRICCTFHKELRCESTWLGDRNISNQWTFWSWWSVLSQGFPSRLSFVNHICPNQQFLHAPTRNWVVLPIIRIVYLNFFHQEGLAIFICSDGTLAFDRIWKFSNTACLIKCCAMIRAELK